MIDIEQVVNTIYHKNPYYTKEEIRRNVIQAIDNVDKLKRMDGYICKE